MSEVMSSVLLPAADTADAIAAAQVVLPTPPLPPTSNTGFRVFLPGLEISDLIVCIVVRMAEKKMIYRMIPLCEGTDGLLNILFIIRDVMDVNFS